jgi:hypothetical protein
VSLIADLVVTSAAAAFAHFGVTLDVPEREPPRAERTVARSQVPKPQPAIIDCPDKQAAIQRI